MCTQFAIEECALSLLGILIYLYKEHSHKTYTERVYVNFTVQ